MHATSTRSRILDAVLGVVADQGLSKLNMDAVAERASVSRQTVYRHFSSRDRLIEEAILREEQLFITHMLEAAEREDTLEPAVAAAVTAALREARAHPVLSQLVEREPASLLPYLLLGRGPVVSAAEPAVAELVRRHRPSLSTTRLRRVADIATRLLLSYVVSPAEGGDDSLSADFARVVVHLVDA